MYDNAVVLDSKLHAGHHVVPVKDFAFARNVLSAPLSASEMVKASREFPIVFPASGKFVPVAQMGYQRDNNLYVDENGKWTARYTPAHLRRYPFVLGERGEAGKYVIMVDANALAEGADEGEALFTEGEIPDGGVVDRARTFLVRFQKELEQTEAFFKPLKDAGVLVPRMVTVSRGDMPVGRVRDLQVVDPEKLAALDDATLAEWVRSGLMALVSAHLQSLDNWNSQRVASAAVDGEVA